MDSASRRRLRSPAPPSAVSVALLLLLGTWGLAADNEAPKAGDQGGGGANAAANDKKKEETTPPLPLPLAGSGPPVLSLWECRQIALEKQPGLAARRASVAFAEARQLAAEDLSVPALVRPDLPIRRQQAALGVKIAQAELHRAEWETIYDVTRTYFGVLYARAQRGVAENALTELAKFQKRTGLHPSDKGVAKAYAPIAQARVAEAVTGEQRALAGLREAMGVGPDYCFTVADTTLPELNPRVCLEELYPLALDRRGEMAKARLSARVVCLEIQAQSVLHHLQAETFASTADIHVEPLPPGLRDGVYQPEAVGIEMPPVLGGSQSNRVAQAEALNCRAEAVVAKTQRLLELEVSNTYQRWLSASQMAADYRSAVAEFKKTGPLMEKEIQDVQTGTATTGPSALDLFHLHLVSRQVEGDYNTAVYQALLALAGLERATAGGFCPGFEAVLCPRGASAPLPPASEQLPPSSKEE